MGEMLDKRSCAAAADFCNARYLSFQSSHSAETTARLDSNCLMISGFSSNLEFGVSEDVDSKLRFVFPALYLIDKEGIFGNLEQLVGLTEEHGPEVLVSTAAVC